MRKRGEQQEERREEQIERPVEKKVKKQKAPKKPKENKKASKHEKQLAKQQKKAARKNKRVDPSIKDIIPYADYDETNDVFVNRDDTAFDIIRIRTKDLMNAGTDELQNDVIAYTKAYRLIQDDIKLYCLNFPCNTQAQVKYFDDRMAKVKKPQFKPWLKLKQDELKYLSENTSQREFYMRISGHTAEECAKNRNLALSALGDLGDRCEYNRRIRIMEKINNPNSFILI